MKPFKWQQFVVCALTLIAFGLIGAGSPANAQTNPVVNSFSFTPSSVDVSINQATAAFMMNVTDTAGIANVYVYLSGPGGPTSVTLYDSTVTPPITAGLASGSTLQNANLTANLTIYGGTLSGPYTVSSIFIGDVAGNSTTLTTSDLTTAGFPTVLTVIDNPAAPKLLGFSMSPSTVNVANSGQPVTFSVSAEDANSADGFGIAYVLVTLTAPASCLGPEAGSTIVYIPSTGSSANGVWTGQIVIPQYDVVGVWSATVQVFDTAGPYLVFSAASLQSLGFPAYVTVTGPSNCATNTDSISGTVHMCRLCGAGVAGVTVTLYSGTTVVATTTTASNGTYTFSSLMPGTYTVVETVPKGYRAVSASPGTGSGGTEVSTSEISVAVTGSNTTFQPDDFVICTVCTQGTCYTTLCQQEWQNTQWCNSLPNCLHDHYCHVYPTRNCTIGGTNTCCNFDCEWAIENFLCQDGSGCTLPRGCNNDLSYNHYGCLVGDVLACQLNIDFSDCGIFRCGFKNLVCQSGQFQGCTVGQVCQIGNCIISGQKPPAGSPRCSASDVDACLQQINNCYSSSNGGGGNNYHNNNNRFCQ